MDTVPEVLKRVDPIWKRRRVDLIWQIFLGICVGFAVYNLVMNSWRQGDTSLIFIAVFYVAACLSILYSIFLGGRYWLRIGQRRWEALRDPQPFLASSQPVAREDVGTLPITINLTWRRGSVLAGITLGIVLAVAAVVSTVLAVVQSGHDPVGTVFIVVAVLSVILLIFGLLAYFTSLRYQPQKIMLTDEGIRSLYMGQVRFVSWKDARVFATYGAQGMRKSTLVATYEVSNERTVVRWAKYVFANPFLTLKSSVQTKEDWNWLVDRVNGMVAARTGLPLLDLSDTAQGSVTVGLVRRGERPFEAAKAVEPAVADARVPVSAMTLSPVMGSHEVRIAQNDEFVRRQRLRGETGKAFGLLAVIALACVLMGLYGIFWGGQQEGFFSRDFGTALFWLGLLMLAVLVLGGYMLVKSGRYWGRVVAKRQEAAQAPERFQMTTQPVPAPELPQPARVRVMMRKSFLFLMVFVETFVIFLVFSMAIIHVTSLLGFFVLLGCTLLASLLMCLFMVPLMTRTNGWSIEITPDGISARQTIVESAVRWQDVRLFSSYGVLRLFGRSSWTRVYELASERTVVRWQGVPARRFWAVSIEPPMSEEEFARWQEQVQGYVVARTGLPLLDLDAAGEDHSNSGRKLSV